MTVKDLIAELNTQNPDAEVLIEDIDDVRWDISLVDADTSVETDGIFPVVLSI